MVSGYWIGRRKFTKIRVIFKIKNGSKSAFLKSPGRLKIYTLFFRELAKMQRG